MAKKLATTPNGMICRTCGEDKPKFHFFNPRGRYNRSFFASGKPDGHTCWDCGGDYKCLGCGQIKPAHQFRIQGRYCADCRIEGKLHNAPKHSVAPTKSIETSESLIISPDSENAANTGGWE